MSAYFAASGVELHLGDCREILSLLGRTFDSCLADPPYQETSAAWDRWPHGWIDAVGSVLPASASLWCFGTARMFLAQAQDFAGWKFAQEALWVKRNGSGPTGKDRLVKVHEWAYHWYRGRWTDLHHEWERVPREGRSRGSAQKGPSAAVHQGARKANAWVDDGLRQPRSVRVIEAPSVRYQRRHQDEKPESVVAELVRECTPLGGVVLDPMAGSGTTAIAAMSAGRSAVLIEQDERLCEIIARRIEAFQEAA